MAVSWRRDRPPYLRLVPRPPDLPLREVEQPDRQARERLFLIELEKRSDLFDLADHLLTPEVEP